jgi:hypothetical protein
VFGRIGLDKAYLEEEAEAELLVSVVLAERGDPERKP